MDKVKLLVVEDDPDLRTQMKWALAQEYQVFLAEDRQTALDVVAKERPAVVTLDLGLPPRPTEVEEGFSVLCGILHQNPLTKVIVVTGQGEKEHALKAIGLGAYDFFPKPIHIDELKVIVSRASYLFTLEYEHRELQRSLGGDSFEGILGTCPKMQEVFSAIRKVAATDVPVLIAGENGTGKELVARALHRKSMKKEGPFVPINCGAIPENLLESELFGHEKGAFTGAHVQRKGRFQSAHGGILFLDEIGELSLPLQVKLLRFLQDHHIERIGGREEIFVDARVIAATNKDLKAAIAEGRFREDLYYRLAVVTVSLPPLREREGDILLLANALLHRYVMENGKKITGFTPHAVRAIGSYHWPGNVREMENRIKRAVIMAEASKISPEDLELAAAYGKHECCTLREAREVLEKDLVQRALGKHKGNLTKTAEELGVSRPTLYELMERLGIARERA